MNTFSQFLNEKTSIELDSDITVLSKAMNAFIKTCSDVKKCKVAYEKSNDTINTLTLGDWFIASSFRNFVTFRSDGVMDDKPGTMFVMWDAKSNKLNSIEFK